LFLFNVDLICCETDRSCFHLNVIIHLKVVVFDIEENEEDMKGFLVYLYQKISTSVVYAYPAR